MTSSIYSNVGFRCESAFNALKNFLINKKINELILDDSKKILNDCLRIENDEKHSLFLSKPCGYEVESILYDYIKEKKDTEIISKLKRIYLNINNLNELDNSQINELCVFFKDIVNLCRDKSTFVSNNDSFMIYRMF